jgi:hypothetical protein
MHGSILGILRSNQDISYDRVFSCSLLHYKLRFKDDVSPEQILVKAALLKQSIDKANATETPTSSNLRLREKGIDKFALRCFNSFSNDRALLQLPTFYTINDKFVPIDLWWLRRYIRATIYAEDPSNDNASFPTDEACESGSVSVFDNYKWHGRLQASLSPYQYTMLVQTGTDGMRDSMTFLLARPIPDPGL